MDKISGVLITNDSKETSLLDVSGLGQRRSIIRRIGTQLPLGFAARPTFELLPNGSNVLKTSGKKSSMFSLADVIQLDDAPESGVPIRASASVPNLNETTSVESIPITSSISATSVTSSASQDHMVTKISALEDELAFLRSQIAALVTTQQQQANASSFNISISSNLEAPLSSSTPVKAPPLPPGIPPPPPPPPPPPLPTTNQTEVMSIQEVIRQRKIAKGQCPSSAPSQRTKSQSSVPDMADVLKDLHKVKLKSVSRSPGGTPFNNKKQGDSDPVAGDPASLIAAALKKKFAHRKNFDSPKSEDVEDSFELKLTPKRNFESPNSTPKFGQHLLKRRNTSPAPSIKPKPELPSFLKKRQDLENMAPKS